MKFKNMEIIELTPNKSYTEKETTKKIFSNVQNTFSVLRGVDLSENVISKINDAIKAINSFSGSERKYRNKLLIQNHNIIELVRKEHGLTPEKYYQNQWFVLGMAVFGMPLGLIFSLVIAKNNGLLGIGLPIGMLIGYMVGKQKDQKAKEQGNQLKISFN